MRLRSRLRTILAGVAGTAGLAYPACAAVCPKGHGSCPYPGRCFLYTDVDANSVCDYTRTASSASQSGAATPVQTTAAASPTATASPAATQSTPAALPAGPAAGEGILHTAPLIGVVLFIAVCAALFWLFRSGRCGVNLTRTGPALALSSLIALVVSEVATYLLMGDAAASSAAYFAALLMLAGTVLSAYLWRSGGVDRKVVVAVAGVSVLFGFVIAALIMPAEFFGLAGIAAGSQTITIGIAAIVVALLLSLITGRTFCAHICPVGSVQELAYSLPAKKVVVRNTGALEAIRLAAFVAALIAGLYAIDLPGFTGAHDFFSLTLSVWSVVFIGILIIAVFVYRPVCRSVCPFGLLFSLFAEFSRFRLMRAESCKGCRKCEKVCPAQVAGINSPKRECYLCARCKEACPEEGALSYRAGDERGHPPRNHPPGSKHPRSPTGPCGLPISAGRSGGRH